MQRVWKTRNKIACARSSSTLLLIRGKRFDAAIIELPLPICAAADDHALRHIVGDGDGSTGRFGTLSGSARWRLLVTLFLVGGDQFFAESRRVYSYVGRVGGFASAFVRCFRSVRLRRSLVDHSAGVRFEGRCDDAL